MVVRTLPESPNTKSGMEQLRRRYWYLLAELDERIANVVFNIIRTPFVVRLAFLVKEIEYDQGDPIEHLDALMKIAIHNSHQMLKG